MERTAQIAAAAARLVVDEGVELGAARRKAAQEVAGRGVRSGELPRNEEVEDEVRAQLRLFHADTHPTELRALRRVAVRWLERLAAHRPHLSGAVWRGIATRRSAIVVDLYCDDPKGAEIDLINQGIRYEAGGPGGHGSQDVIVLSVNEHCPELAQPVTLHLLLHDLDDLRGALKPDGRGLTWRGDLPALRRRIEEDAAR